MTDTRDNVVGGRRVFEVVWGAALVLAFFLPWVSAAGLLSLSGYHLFSLDIRVLSHAPGDAPWDAWALLLIAAIPLAGLATVVLAATGKSAKVTATVAAAVTSALLLDTLIRGGTDGFAAFDVGAYLTLVCSAGVVASAYGWFSPKTPLSWRTWSPFERGLGVAAALAVCLAVAVPLAVQDHQQNKLFSALSGVKNSHDESLSTLQSDLNRSPSSKDATDNADTATTAPTDPSPTYSYTPPSSSPASDSPPSSSPASDSPPRTSQYTAPSSAPPTTNTYTPPPSSPPTTRACPTGQVTGAVTRTSDAVQYFSTPYYQIDVDVSVTNGSSDPINLSYVEFDVFDAHGAMVDHGQVATSGNLGPGQTQAWAGTVYVQSPVAPPPRAQVTKVTYRWGPGVPSTCQPN